MSPYIAAGLLGVVAGMRTQLPLALLAYAAGNGRFAATDGPPLAWLRRPWVRRLTTVAAAGELIGDKLPMTPSRLDPGPLTGRFLFGALSGCAVAVNCRRSPLIGAALGASGAGLGAYAGYHARKGLGAATSLPDPLIAVGEDAVAVSLGLTAVDLAATAAD